MNLTKMFLNRNIFNSKLNREKFQKNKMTYCIKHKSNSYQLNHIRNYHSYQPENDGNEPPDWKLFAMAALGLYIINISRR